MIFLDLQKAYNALDRSRCLDILEGYGVGPRALHLLHRYWARLDMVAWTGRYYRVIFHGESGVTQGDPLSPTITTVVVDAVVFHWESQFRGVNRGGAAEMKTRQVRQRRDGQSGEETTGEGG